MCVYIKTNFRRLHWRALLKLQLFSRSYFFCLPEHYVYSDVCTHTQHVLCGHRPPVSVTERTETFKTKYVTTFSYAGNRIFRTNIVASEFHTFRPNHRGQCVLRIFPSNYAGSVTKYLRTRVRTTLCTRHVKKQR